MMTDDDLFRELNSDIKKDSRQILKGYFDNIKLSSLTGVPVILHKNHAVVGVDGIIKSISLIDFKRIVDASIGDLNNNISPIALPFGCFLFMVSMGNININCYYPECIGGMQFESGGEIIKYKIPFPNVIVSFSLTGIGDNLWQVQQVKYFSTTKTVTQLPDDKFINDTDPANGIHRLPVSNMYGDNRMCYGKNTMPVRFTNNLRGLDYYYQILTVAPFNSDLGIVGLTQTYSPANWYKFLSGKKEYPYELLSKSNNR